MQTRLVPILLVLLLLGLGCSKSSTTQASSESSSKISSSPFTSSSKSSGGEDEEAEEAAYRRDVRDATARFAESQEALAQLERDLSLVAESYGVTDWEQIDATYVAIGRGLAVAETAETRVRELAVAMSREDHRKLALIRWGYEGSATR